MSEFEVELRALINVHSKEGDSDTPDFILARYLIQSLEAFTEATKARDKWYKAETEEQKEEVTLS